MSSVIRKLQSSPDMKNCMKFLKDDLKAAAKALGKPVSGNKDDLCNRILAGMVKRPKAKTPSPARVPPRPRAATPPPPRISISEEDCKSFTNAQLGNFLKYFKHPQVYKMNKAQMCTALENYKAKGMFQWKKPYILPPRPHAAAPPRVSSPSEHKSPLRPAARKCTDFKSNELKAFLIRLRAPGPYPRRKEDMCKLLDHYVKTGQFSWVPPHIVGGAATPPAFLAKGETMLIPYTLKNSINKDKFTAEAQLSFIAKHNMSLATCASILNSKKESYTFKNAVSFLLASLTHDEVSHAIEHPEEAAANAKFIQCFVMDIFEQAARKGFKTIQEAFAILANTVKDYLYLKKIGVDSAFGSAYLTHTLRSDGRIMNNPFAVTKLAQRRGERNQLDEIYHEIAIGYVLNELKAIVPNFSYTYGGYICDTPQAFKEGQPQCSSKTPIDITVLSMQEFIPDSKFLSKWIEEWKTKGESTDTIINEVSKVMIQIAHALYQAEKRFRYVHYDLHGQNVLVKKLETPIYNMVIEDADKGYYVILRKVEYVPYIIDYGMNVAVKDGVVFKNNRTGNGLMQDLGATFDNYYYPGFDMWRFNVGIMGHMIFSGFRDLSSKFSGMLDSFLGMYKAPSLKTPYKKSWQALWAAESISPRAWYSVLSNDRYQYIFCSPKDRSMFQQDSGDWIKHITHATRSI